MTQPPVLRGGPAVRSVSLLLGLFLFSVGLVLQLESGLGLPPWDVLNQGLAAHTPLSFGQANVGVSLCVLALAAALGARIGLGTVANAVLIGLFVDLLLTLDWVDGLAEASLGARIAMLLGGIAIVGLGSGFYLGAAFGAGPRDSLMVIAGQRTGRRLGIVRGAIEVPVAALGFALGGTVGIGTVLFAFGVGFAVEAGCAALVRVGVAESGGRIAAA
ncbi:MAG: hypothetical protein EXQ77_05025 [Thermoleophilia bacterium]|nr:hypothetical protein [Thermoleophilia bacterium]